jgi:hypothetical protein
VKHFMIGLLPELLQQVKYEGVDTLEDVIRIAEKKEASLKSTPIIPTKDATDIHLTSLRTSSIQRAFTNGGHYRVTYVTNDTI